ncbi:MAG: CDP-alcohol phosphatidyltransferase family protein [Acidobacteriota bacterium]|nr:MAG: CDP-alcohol phosphatidyltransferase family protein [Acidobacteriota bacterium]
MNLPNYLTLARIFLVPILVVVLLTPFSEKWFGIQSYALAIAIFLVATLTDILDGHLARRRKQVSKFGALLDPDRGQAAGLSCADRACRETPCACLGGRHHSGTRVRSYRTTVRRGHRRDRDLCSGRRQDQDVVPVHRHSRASGGRRELAASLSQTSGWQLPSAFWQVAEVQTAFCNLFDLSLTANDWKVFGYLRAEAPSGSLCLPPAGRCTAISGSSTKKARKRRPGRPPERIFVSLFLFDLDTVARMDL